MSHASRATITLGGGGAPQAPKSSFQSMTDMGGQSYGAPPSRKPQVIGSTRPAATNGVQSPPSGETPQSPQGEVQYPWRQQGRRERRRRENVPEHQIAAAAANDVSSGQPQPTYQQYPQPGPVTYAQPAQTGIQQPGGTEYIPGRKQSDPASPATQPTYLRDDVMQQAQFHVRPVGGSGPSRDVRYDQPDAARAPQQPAQSIVDQARAEEARQKLAELNLSPQMIAQYRRKFNVLDLNKDGVVNLREFAAISRVLGYKFAREEIVVSWRRCPKYMYM